MGFTAAFNSAKAFDSHLQNDSSAKDFKPPGELIESYTSKDREFEIWSGELTDLTVRETIQRMQIFISFFVEGGTPLELNDEEWTQSRWRVFFLYLNLPLLKLQSSLTRFPIATKSFPHLPSQTPLPIP